MSECWSDVRKTPLIRRAGKRPEVGFKDVCYGEVTPFAVGARGRTPRNLNAVRTCPDPRSPRHRGEVELALINLKRASATAARFAGGTAIAKNKTPSER